MKKRDGIGFSFEKEAIAEGFSVIAGVDEVGRGCLAGAVVAAAVVFGSESSLPEGLNDSKKLSRKRREELNSEIIESALTYGVAQVEAEEIDRINILEATRLAMISAVGQLDPAADFLLIDAVRLTGLRLPQRSIIKGDTLSASIAASSIVAKVYRDRLMRQFDEVYPEYGFASHVGYGTKAHFDALGKHGPCPLHRRSFHGVIPGGEAAAAPELPFRERL